MAMLSDLESGSQLNHETCMLNPVEFLAYCQQLQLPGHAIGYLKWIRESGPSREVQCGHGNIIAKYPSRKTNRVVPAHKELLFGGGVVTQE